MRESKVDSLTPHSQHLSELMHKEVTAAPDTSALLAQWDVQGLPHRRMEDWKYTTDFSWAKEVAHFNHGLEALTPVQQLRAEQMRTRFPFHLFFLDGKLLPELCQLPEHIQRQQSAADHPASANPVLALNHIVSSLKTSLLVRANKGEIAELFIGHFTSARINSYQTHQWQLILETHANLKLIESTWSDQGEAILNTLGTITLRDGATLHHTRLTLTGRDHVAHQFLNVNVGGKAQYHSYYIGSGGQQVRQELSCRLSGEGAHVTACGLYDVRHDEHHDLHINVEHLVPHTTGEYYFKGSLRDKAHAVFTGNIVIAHLAQKTNAELLNKNLLLGDKARIDTRPQLHVFADDVKAGHGATIGRISEEELFYLESRGIDRQRGFELLCQGFIEDIFQRLPEEQRAPMRQSWQEWRTERGGL